MKHNVEKYLEDIRLSIVNIETYTISVKSVREIEDNFILFDALCRRFAIIGEALYQADKIDDTILISEKNKIKGLRHIIVHDYDMVRASDLWKIIQKNLPTLKEEVIKILNS
jgi:uncharacterized protein with HEPN domain